MPNILFHTIVITITLICVAFLPRGTYICDESKTYFVPEYTYRNMGTKQQQLVSVESHWQTDCIKSHTEWHGSLISNLLKD